MMIAQFKKIGHWVGRFLYLQLFISLIALPILLCWGLPLSILSPVGNLIFGPALTFFLFLSCLFFFTELLYIPNGFIAWVLDLFTQKWLHVINISPQPWLFGFAKPSLFLLVSIPICALLVVHYKHFKSVWHSVLCLAVLLSGSCLYIKMAHTKTQDIQTLACNNGEVTIIHSGPKTVLIDPGVIGRRISACSWVEFTLLPHLISSSGANTIDDLILLQPGAMLFQAVSTLMSKIKIKKIYLVYWQGSLAKHEWRSFFQMRELAQKQGIVIERISYKKIHIPLKNGAITVEPRKEQITEKEITYPAITVHGALKSGAFEITSKKYKK
jgi:beta-lactamase superfamily II metal-dependent hydrolase